MKGKEDVRDIITILKSKITRRPVGHCKCCQKVEYVDELQLLPDVEAHVRQLALSLLKKGPDLAPLDEKALHDRYGYGSKSVFCRDCLRRLVENASD